MKKINSILYFQLILDMIYLIFNMNIEYNINPLFSIALNLMFNLAHMFACGMLAMV